MARWDQAAAPWLTCAGLPLGLASWGALGDGGGGLRFPVCHPERSEGASFGGRSGLRGKDPSAASPPQDDRRRGVGASG